MKALVLALFAFVSLETNARMIGVDDLVIDANLKRSEFSKVYNCKMTVVRDLRSASGSISESARGGSATVDLTCDGNTEILAGLQIKAADINGKILARPEIERNFKVESGLPAIEIKTKGMGQQDRTEKTVYILSRIAFHD